MIAIKDSQTTLLRCANVGQHFLSVCQYQFDFLLEAMNPMNDVFIPNRNFKLDRSLYFDLTNNLKIFMR